MDSIRLLIILILIIASLSAMGLAIYLLHWRWMPGVTSFLILMLTTIAYDWMYIGEIGAADFSTAKFWFDLQHIPIPFQHYFWLSLSLYYADIMPAIARQIRRLALLYPALFCTIYFTNPWHHLYIKKFAFVNNGNFQVIQTEKGPLFLLLLVFGSLIAMLAASSYLVAMISRPRLQRSGYALMLVAAGIPWASLYFHYLNLSLLGLDYFPMLSLISCGIIGYVFFRYRFFSIEPIAYETAFRKGPEAIFLLNGNRDIVDVSDAMAQLYPELANLKRPLPLTAWMTQRPEYCPLQQEMEEAEAPPFRVNYGEPGDAERIFLARTIPVVSRLQLSTGWMVRLEDVTLHLKKQAALEEKAQAAAILAERNELSFLQAQIKPHFLSNTLSVIGSMIVRDPDGARNLIASLGAYLAQSCYFDSEEEMIPLADEMEAVRLYLEIEQARFGSRLKFRVEGSAPDDLRVPRLIIQPLVENALRHGVLKKAGGGCVRLRIEQRPGYFMFAISDDGAGIAPGEIPGLLEWKPGSDMLGLVNVQRRLLKHFGFGLNISSRQGEGTTVCFRIPDPQAKGVKA